MKITNQQKKSIPFQYAYDVLEGNIVVGNKIKLAIKRFFQLIEDADEKGYYLDHNSGMDIIDFFPWFLVHTKGPLAGKPFVLSPYQQFTYYNIFAWKIKKTGNRLINTVYEKVGRKNGKTAGLSGLGLAAMAIDNVSSPEIFVGATKEAQAKTLWDQAVQFIKKSNALRQSGFKPLQREIRLPSVLGSFKFLGGDSKTLDSLNPSVSFIDEYHAHKDASILEVLETAMGARTNPLVYIITTAGTNVYSVCKLLEDDLTQILEGRKEDDHTLIMIHDLDKEDDWKDEKNWIKANPNLHYNPPMLAHLKREFIKTETSPSKIPNFKTKYLNMWVDAPEVWIPNEIWQKNKVNDFEGYENYEDLFTAKAKEFGSYGAVDLSTRKDTTSFSIITNPDKNNNLFLKVFVYCPADIIDVRSREDGVPYRFWADTGLLTSTPGNVVDYEYLLNDIRKYYYQYYIERIEFDEWNSTHVVNILMKEDFNVSYFGQGIRNMSFPTKQFERLVYKENLKHDGNVILEWALSGCVLIVDPNENIKVDKGRSHKNGKKRIDSIVSSIMAFAATIKEPEETNESKYNNPEEEISFGI
ncbi:MAG TPA: terminase large subunit [Lutibacter sp.]|nr:terminase large subunit [Lutibacter sp.]